MTKRKKMINYKKLQNVGIAGFGAYIPYLRITTEEIADIWQKNGKAIVSSLGVIKKAIGDKDEDCITMACQASLSALEMTKIDNEKIGACFMGSESFPYAVKPASTILGDILQIGSQYFSADLQFACKAGTAGIQIICAMIEAGMINYGLAIGSDKSQAKPSDALEYTAGSGAGAFLLSSNPHEWVAKINCTFSTSSDTPDFWRREKEDYPTHTGRFSGEPAYFKQIIQSSKLLFEKTKTGPKDYDWAIFHAPNKKFPEKVASILGFNKEQLKHSLLVEKIGNPYSASSLISLANVLENAKPKDKIFMASYGSGAGSDCFSITTTDLLIEKRKNLIKQMVENTKEINYSKYLQTRNLL
jgi:hydroxymethylglutaryl-CoA synthase